MTGDTAFAKRRPEANFDFWQPPRMASQIQRRRAARRTHAAPCAAPWPGLHKSRLKLSTRARSRHKLIRSRRRPAPEKRRQSDARCREGATGDWTLLPRRLAMTHWRLWYLLSRRGRIGSFAVQL